ncbi:MAG: hypothetical protein ACYCOO_00400 [Chitinophagaceae bacterium]
MKKHVILMTLVSLSLFVQAQAQNVRTSLTGLHPASLSGSWRIYSERLFYDVGGGGAWESSGFQNLSIHSNGSYNFGSSRGTWSVQPITASDWKTWKVGSYGPTQKIVLNGWDKGTASGPLEGNGSQVTFVWVLYRVTPPLVRAPGTVDIKFGH